MTYKIANEAVGNLQAALHRHGFLRILNRSHGFPGDTGSAFVQVRCPRFLVEPVARWLAIHGLPTARVDRDSVQVKTVKRVGFRTFRVQLTYRRA